MWFSTYKELCINFLYKTEGFHLLGKLFLVRITAQPFVQPLFSPFINGMFTTLQVTRGSSKYSQDISVPNIPWQVNHSLREVLKSQYCDDVSSSWITGYPWRRVCA